MILDPVMESLLYYIRYKFYSYLVSHFPFALYTKIS
jgi:hypothetical protein